MECFSIRERERERERERKEEREKKKSNPRNVCALNVRYT